MNNPFLIYKEEFMRPDLAKGMQPATVIPHVEYLARDGIILNVFSCLLVLLAKNKLGDLKVVYPLGKFAEKVNKDKKTVKIALDRLHELNIIRYTSAEYLNARSFEAIIHTDPKMWKLELIESIEQEGL